MCVALSNRHQIRPNIYVDTNDVRFLKQVDSDLTLLESQEVGKRLITRISGGKHAVYISKGISDEAIALGRWLLVLSWSRMFLKNYLFFKSRPVSRFERQSAYNPGIFGTGARINPCLSLGQWKKCKNGGFG